MMARRVGLAIGLTVAHASVALAQVLTGTVARHGQPVEGAIILLVASGGRESARAASQEAGRYEVRAPAGIYHVRVLQIGWRPATLGPVVLREGASTSANFDLVAPRLALAAITVADRLQCTVRPDSSAAAFAVWDAARASLLASTLTSAEPVVVTLARSDRMLARDGEHILSDSSSTHTTRTLVPVRSLDARTLNDSGYVSDAAGERTFWAPDAEVLLSPEFLSTHCITAVASSNPDSAALIGVRFAPAARRRGVVDIEGVLWLDRHSAQLRTMEYRYVNVSSVVRQMNAGGVVEFLRIPRGKLIVHRWSMRYPMIAVRTSGGGVLLPGLRTERDTREDLLGLRVSSGSVLEVRRGEDIVWQRGRVSIIARVVDSSSAVPVPRVLLGLVTAADATGTDSSGAVRLELLAPGDYTVRLRSAELTDLGVPQLLRQITVPDANDAVVTIAIPSARSIVASRCGRRSLDWGEGMLTGRLSGDGTRLVTASIIALSRTPYARLGGGEPIVVDRMHQVTPDVDGTFYLCGIPRDAAVRVRKSSDAPGTGIVVKFADHAVTAVVPVP